MRTSFLYLAKRCAGLTFLAIILLLGKGIGGNVLAGETDLSMPQKCFQYFQQNISKHAFIQRYTLAGAAPENPRPLVYLLRDRGTFELAQKLADPAVLGNIWQPKINFTHDELKAIILLTLPHEPVFQDLVARLEQLAEKGLYYRRHQYRLWRQLAALLAGVGIGWAGFNVIKESSFIISPLISWGVLSAGSYLYAQRHGAKFRMAQQTLQEVLTKLLQRADQEAAWGAAPWQIMIVLPPEVALTPFQRYLGQLGLVSLGSVQVFL